jgi:release factor glutamine methyltransferase
MTDTAQRARLVATLRAAGCVFAEDEAEVLFASADSPERLEEMVDQRTSGVPLEHVVGWAMFCGVRVEVDPGVFVPRSRTALMVRLAVQVAHPRATVLDLCCGTGAIGAAVATQFMTEVVGTGIRLYASDVDPRAVACAARNLARFNATVVGGDLFDALPDELREHVDVLVANVPYVPTDAIALLPAEARRYEDRVALDGGGDGLDVLRRVAAQAPSWLSDSGVLLVETSQQQAVAAASELSEVGLRAAIVTDDELDVAVVMGHASPPQ